MMLGKNSGVVNVLPHIPKMSVGVEIGVWKGDSSALFLEKCYRLHLVDPWSVEPYKESEEYDSYDDYVRKYGASPQELQKRYDEIYQSVRKRFARDPVTIHRKTSAEFFENFRSTVDWFYIDGDHSYSGCLADLKAAIGKYPQFIFGDDYGNKPGVTKAVDEVKSMGFKVSKLGGNQYGIYL